MKTEELYTMIQQKPVILDGATGSNLQKVGMKPGVCPEEWILENEDKLIDLQKSFVEAGTNILYAPTFSGNRIKLEEYGLADRAEEINKRLVGLSKRAAGDKALVAGDMTMTGVALESVGPMKLEALINIYKEQAKYLLEAGVDLFVVETMMSLAETRAAVIAIKEVCNLPVIASLTFQEDGRTLYGTDPVTAVVVLQSIGADIIGVNCSTGPGEMIPVIKKMKEYAEVPILAKPNAGLPVLEDGVTVYPMTPEEFASWGPAFIEAGAGLIGGGSTPEHIRMLAEKVSGLTTKAPCNIHPIMLASERKSQEIALDGKFLVIGERINPTGKKKLQEELRAGKLDLVEEMAEQQEEMGAHILDINMGTNGIDEKEMMLKAISKVTMVSSLPLCIDTKDPQEIIKFCKQIAPTFGGINLEDISAPRCVEIERTLKKELDIPVFHDDQHGTAIVVTAALVNALKVVDKKPEDVTVVVSGTGAAGSSIIHMIHDLGVKEIYGFNINGIVIKDDYDKYDFLTQELTAITNKSNKRMTMAEAVKEADVFIGVSAPGLLTKEMVQSMKEKPIVFAMANPEPEIKYHDAVDAGAAVVGTGRSDFPNQINNVLAFPGLFRGALDVHATKITEGMKLAAAKGLASLVSDEELNKDYIIPRATDARVAVTVAKAVSDQAIKEDVIANK